MTEQPAAAVGSGTPVRASSGLGSATRRTWNREYADRRAIPSSHRGDPSTAFHDAWSDLDPESLHRALDVGCGNGRNSVVCARAGLDVVALDFAEEPLELARTRVRDQGITSDVDLVQSDVTTGIPLATDSVDLLIDSYASCHFVRPTEFLDYVDEAARVLEPGGYLYWSGLGVDDEYYAQLSDTHPAPGVVEDPLNGIPKRLYSERDVREQFDRLSDGPVTVREFRFQDTVDGTDYRRQIFATLFTV